MDAFQLANVLLRVYNDRIVKELFLTIQDGDVEVIDILADRLEELDYRRVGEVRNIAIASTLLVCHTCGGDEVTVGKNGNLVCQECLVEGPNHGAEVAILRLQALFDLPLRDMMPPTFPIGLLRRSFGDREAQDLMRIIEGIPPARLRYHDGSWLRRVRIGTACECQQDVAIGIPLIGLDPEQFTYNFSSWKTRQQRQLNIWICYCTNCNTLHWARTITFTDTQ